MKKEVVFRIKVGHKIGQKIKYWSVFTFYAQSTFPFNSLVSRLFNLTFSNFEDKIHICDTDTDTVYFLSTNSVQVHILIIKSDRPLFYSYTVGLHVCNLWTLGQKTPLRFLKDGLAIEIFDEMYKRCMILAEWLAPNLKNRSILPQMFVLCEWNIELDDLIKRSNTNTSYKEKLLTQKETFANWSSLLFRSVLSLCYIM